MQFFKKFAENLLCTLKNFCEVVEMQQEQEKKFIHLTSDKDKKVAEKIAEVSKKIFERNREAYRILANK